MSMANFKRNSNKHIMIIVLIFCCTRGTLSIVNWNSWWKYETGISGPSYWGRVGLKLWAMCSQGKEQSPVNVEPGKLLFDPQLKPLRVRTGKVHGTLRNTGHDVTFDFDDDAVSNINVTGGPLNYNYRISSLKLHWGATNALGSEHRIGNQSWPAELQFYAYNAELYRNVSQAQDKTKGLAVLVVFAQLASDETQVNSQLDRLSSQLKSIKYLEQNRRIRDIAVSLLLPSTAQYMTYEGSLTQPPCYETVRWILLNKPIYIRAETLQLLRLLSQGNSAQQETELKQNLRPLMRLRNRVVRTNINLPGEDGRKCAARRPMTYATNKKAIPQMPAA